MSFNNFSHFFLVCCLVSRWQLLRKEEPELQETGGSDSISSKAMTVLGPKESRLSLGEGLGVLERQGTSISAELTGLVSGARGNKTPLEIPGR